MIVSVDSTEPEAARTDRARIAVLALFLVQGIVIGSWVAHIPVIKDQFSLSDAALGLTLFAIAVGSVSSLLTTGPLIARYGSRRLTWVATMLFALTLPILGIVRVYPVLVVLLILFGAFVSAMDVAMNAQGIGVEGRKGHPVMSTFHALWSVGGLIGAGLASLVLSYGVSPELHLVAIAIPVAVVGFLSRPWLLPAETDQHTDGPTFIRPPRALLGLGLIAILAMMSEGAVGDWSGVYLRDWLGMGVGFAATGFAAFSLTMTVGRLFGDTIRSRIDATLLLRLSGGLAAFGLAFGLLLNQPWAALIGFACMGFGLSNIVPIVFSYSGRLPGIPVGTAVAAVATMGYAGFLAGPPLIGFVAQSTILPVGLGLVVVFTALIAGTAKLPVTG